MAPPPVTAKATLAFTGLTCANSNCDVTRFEPALTLTAPVSNDWVLNNLVLWGRIVHHRAITPRTVYATPDLWGVSGRLRENRKEYPNGRVVAYDWEAAVSSDLIKVPDFLKVTGKLGRFSLDLMPPTWYIFPVNFVSGNSMMDQGTALSPFGETAEGTVVFTPGAVAGKYVTVGGIVGVQANEKFGTVKQAGGSVNLKPLGTDELTLSGAVGWMGKDNPDDLLADRVYGAKGDASSWPVYGAQLAYKTGPLALTVGAVFGQKQASRDYYLDELSGEHFDNQGRRLPPPPLSIRERIGEAVTLNRQQAYGLTFRYAFFRVSVSHAEMPMEQEITTRDFETGEPAAVTSERGGTVQDAAEVGLTLFPMTATTPVPDFLKGSTVELVGGVTTQRASREQPIGFPDSIPPSRIERENIVYGGLKVAFNATGGLK